MSPRECAGAAALRLADVLRRAMRHRDLRRQRREANYG